MQVDRAFPDADLLREVLHRHLLVAVAREQTIGGVENDVFDIFLNVRWLSFV